MKSLLAAAVLVLVASIPAHAQMGVISGLSINPMPPNVPILPHYAPASYQMLALSGNVTDFFSSTFLSYGEALHEGIAMAARDRQRITLVEVARETRAAHKNPARVFFVQDAHGNAVLMKEKD